MSSHRFNDERKQQLRERLEILYEKLHEFEKAVDLSDGISQKIALRQQLKGDLLPKLRELEHEYAMLLADHISTDAIPEPEADQCVSDLLIATGRVARYAESGASKEMLDLLELIHRKLDEPEKSAAAKLKLALPILPLIASYELELDTENFIHRTWRSIQALFERASKS
jgi:hypothetical protein